MRIQSDFSHTIDGLFWFDLPVGILLAYIFHNIVRDSLFDNLPWFLKSRFIKFKKFDWNESARKNFSIVVVSILIGAASHLFWDSFTHESGNFVRKIPQLTSSVDLSGFQISVFKILQHASSLVGGLVIVFAILQLKPEKNVTGQISIKYWGIISLLSLAIIMIRLISGLDIQMYGHVLVSVISAGLLSLILTPLLLKLK